jgi:aminoglycoside phosphotransferase (APT) family kinase protein
MRGGFWADLFSFSVAGTPPGWPSELVVRLMPDPDLARKETIVQSAVAAAGFPTPVVRASGGPDAGFGRAFMIMDRAPGAPLLSGLSGPGIVTSALSLRRLPEVLATTMASLHALDAGPIRRRLEDVGDVPVTPAGLLDWLGAAAAEYGRPDLESAAGWLTDHRPGPAPDVVCHGDLHPFNLLSDGDQVNLVDWSAALIGPRAHDVAFTSLLLAEPPVPAPAPVRSVVRSAGRILARRFVRRYQDLAGLEIPEVHLRWHQGLVALRVLVEVAGWAHSESTDGHDGHPWLTSGPAIAGRLGSLTGVDVAAR